MLYRRAISYNEIAHFLYNAKKSKYISITHFCFFPLLVWWAISGLTAIVSWVSPSYSSSSSESLSSMSFISSIPSAAAVVSNMYDFFTYDVFVSTMLHVVVLLSFSSQQLCWVPSPETLTSCTNTDQQCEISSYQLSSVGDHLSMPSRVHETTWSNCPLFCIPCLLPSLMSNRRGWWLRGRVYTQHWAKLRGLGFRV